MFLKSWKQTDLAGIPKAFDLHSHMVRKGCTALAGTASDGEVSGFSDALSDISKLSACSTMALVRAVVCMLYCEQSEG